MRKQKKNPSRDKNTGKFVSGETPINVIEEKKGDYTFKAILLIVFVFVLLLILNNTRILSSISTLDFQTNKTSTNNTFQSTANDSLDVKSEAQTSIATSNIQINKDSTTKIVAQNQLDTLALNTNQIARILVKYGNVNIISKGDLDSNQNLYPGKIIKNGDQITVGEYPSYISFILNNDNSVIVMYDNTNAQIVFSGTINSYKVKNGKIHANIRNSSKPTSFISQNSIVNIGKQDYALMNLLFDEGQDQFVTIDGQATIINELSGLSLKMIKQQKLFSTKIGQLIWSLAIESDFIIGPKKELVILPIEKEIAKELKPIKKISKKLEIITEKKPKITIKPIKVVKPKPIPPKPKPIPPKPVINYDKTRDYDFNVAIDIIKKESIVTYLERPLMSDIPVYYFPDINSELVSSISEQEKFIVYPIHRSGFLVVGRLGTGPLGYAEYDLINFSSEDRLGKIIDLSKTRFTIDKK